MICQILVHKEVGETDAVVQKAENVVIEDAKLEERRKREKRKQLNVVEKGEEKQEENKVN